MFEFWKAPRVGEVYNLGGGKANSCSILEAFRMAEDVTGKPMKWRYVDENRIGDHICYYSDLRKMKAHYPAWRITKTLPTIFEEIAASWKQRLSAGSRMRILITGVCGFVGSALAECLLRAGGGIRDGGHRQPDASGCGDESACGCERLGVEFVHGDLRSASDLDGLPACDWVIDAAANPSVLAGLSGGGQQPPALRAQSGRLRQRTGILQGAQGRAVAAQQQPRLLHSRACRHPAARARPGLRPRRSRSRCRAG